MGAPKLTVVIPTTHPWPEVALPLRSIWPQITALGDRAELVVAAGHPDGLPPEGAYPELVGLTLPGATVFQLRAAGIARARGEVIAVTEDHVQVAPDYCDAVMRSHAEHPEALMIGGAVANGALDPVGWASYFMSNISALPPDAGTWSAPLTGQANITYKARLLHDHRPEALPSAQLRAQLATRGLALNDPRIRVLHIQSLGVAGSLAHHFHDGRYVAACRRAELHGLRWALELAKDLSLPWRVPVATARVLSRTARRYPSLWKDLLVSAPLVGLMMGAHCLGELAGFAGGEGDSARHIP